MTERVEAISTELVREMAKPEPLPTRSLHGLLDDLEALEGMQEEAAALGETANEKAAQDAIARYVDAQIVEKKADGICAHIREWKARADVELAEAARLIDMAKRYQARAEALQAATLNAMLTHGIKEIRTDRNTLKTRQNGGVGELQVDDVTALPAWGRRRGITLSDQDWESISLFVYENAPGFRYERFKSALERAKPEEDNTAIRKVLNERVKCEHCDGNGQLWPEDPNERSATVDCPRCNGEGTVPRTLPGVRIKDRAFRLVME